MKGWAEKTPTPLRVLQWSAEGTVLKGYIVLPMAAGEPRRVDSRGPGSLWHLRNMTELGEQPVSCAQEC